MFQRPLVIAFASISCVAVIGCVSPPSHFSVRSAASPEAPAARAASVGRALHEEPPLPGADTEGWSGLAPTGTTPMHHHGMHMQGMDMSGMQGMDMSGMEGMDMPDAGTSPPLPAPTDAMPGMQGMTHAH